MVLHLRKIFHVFLITCLLGAGVLTAMPSLHSHEHHKLNAQQLFKYFHLKLKSQQQPTNPDQDEDGCVICRTLSHFVVEQPPVAATITFVYIHIPYTVSLYQKPPLVLTRNSLIPRAPPVFL